MEAPWPTPTWGWADVTQTLVGHGSVIPYETALLARVVRYGYDYRPNIFNGQLDPNVPATLSASVMQGILRTQMGNSMGSITQR